MSSFTRRLFLNGAVACECREREIARRIGIPHESRFRSEAETSLYFAEAERVEREMGLAPMERKLDETGPTNWPVTCWKISVSWSTRSFQPHRRGVAIWAA
jgi:hypothetical protein